MEQSRVILRCGECKRGLAIVCYKEGEPSEWALKAQCPYCKGITRYSQVEHVPTRFSGSGFHLDKPEDENEVIAKTDMTNIVRDYDNKVATIVVRAR